MDARRYLISIACLVVNSLPSVAGPGWYSISVEIGQTPQLAVPLSIDLEGLVYGEALPTVWRLEGQQRVALACQLEPGPTARLWFVPDKVWGPNTVVNLQLRFEQDGPMPQTVTARVDKGLITLQAQGKEILRYHCATHPVPDGVDPLYRRSGFIHPLWSPAGNVLTCIQPPDHYHHYGIWNPWTATIVQGKEVDFWNLAKGQGTVRFAGLLSTVNGPVYGGFKVRQEHLAFVSQQGELVAINEVWDVRACMTAIDGRPVWLVDLATILNPAIDSPIELPSYRYGGGIGFRATEDWTRENCSVLTSEGKTRDQADGTRARWCDVRGSNKSGQVSGILFLSHPSNRDHPEPMRVWPSDAHKEKGYLFFEFCPIRLNGWSLQPGREHCLRYRLIVYDGTLDPKTMEVLWQNYAYPPRAVLK